MCLRSIPVHAIFFVLMAMVPRLACSQQFVVLDSSAKKIVIGASVGAHDVIKLARLESLTVISESGEMKEVKGPFNDTLTASTALVEKAAAVKQALGRLLTERTEESLTLGTVRRLSATTAWLAPFAQKSLNVVSAEHDGVQCVLPGIRLNLLRQATQPEIAQLREVPGEYLAFGWAENEYITPWPESVLVQDAGVYLLRRTGTSIPYRVKIRLLSENFTQTAPSYQVGALLAYKCLVQAEMARHAANL